MSSRHLKIIYGKQGCYCSTVIAIFATEGIRVGPVMLSMSAHGRKASQNHYALNVRCLAVPYL
jgi:hypothetical protein